MASPHPSDPPLPAPVHCAADALHIISLAVTRPLAPETLCFLLDHDGIGGIITVVSGTSRPDAVIDVVQFMGRVAAGVPRAEALVVASVRPATGLLPGDVDRWLEASDALHRDGIELLEWFVIGPQGAVCPRDLLGEPERWPQASTAPGIGTEEG